MVTPMFVTVYGASKEVLIPMIKEIKTSALIYPDGKGMFFIQGFIYSLEALDNAFKADDEFMARRLAYQYPNYTAAIVPKEVR